MKLRHLLPILPAVVLLAGCAQTEQKLSENTANELAGPQLTAQPVNLVVFPDDRPSIPDGAPVYKQNCASCHTGGGAGGGAPTVSSTPTTSPEGLPAANAAPPPSGGKASATAFDQRWANSTKPIDIYKVIAFGEKGHKKYSDTLSTRQLWDVVAYTHSIGQPALDAKEIAAVDPVFGSNCAVCHGTKGDGDGPLMRNLEPAPANFQRFERFMNRTDDVLFDHIANGIRWEGMPNFLNKKDEKKGITFDQAYIKKLVQYVRKFHINQDPVMSANMTATGVVTPPAASGGQQQPAGASSTTTSTGTTTTTGTPSGTPAATPAGTTSGTSTNTTTNTASH